MHCVEHFLFGVSILDRFLQEINVCYSLHLYLFLCAGQVLNGFKSLLLPGWTYRHSLL